jgi:acetylornithine deacetylase
MTDNKKNSASLIADMVERKRENIVGFLRDLIKIPSITGDEKRVQEFIAKHLKSMGLEVDVWEPDKSKMKDHPEFIDTGKDYVDRPNVVGVFRGNGGRSLLLNGHTDVVTPEPVQKWENDPWGAKISQGRIYGRGACDMKGGVAGMIKALEILLELDLAPLGDIILEVVVDEESSGNGTLASLLKGYNADAAVFTEPTLCAIMPACRGAKFWRLHVDGYGAHGGVKYKGISATEKGMLVYNALLELESSRNNRGKKHPLYRDYPLATPICIGKFNSGRYTSAMPQECMMEGTIELVPGEQIEQVKDELIGTIKKVSEKDEWLKHHPPRIEWFGLTAHAAEISVDHPFVKTFESVYTEMNGKKAQVIGFPAACDMRIRILYSKTPSILFGPGDLSLAHRADEYIEIEETLLFVKTLALGMLEWSKREEE